MLLRVALVTAALSLPVASACATSTTATPSSSSSSSSSTEAAQAGAAAGAHDAGHDAHHAGHGAAAAPAAERAPDAVATIESRSGSAVTGVVRFYEDNGAVRVVAELKGLAPGPHGFHLHEVGDCSAPDASSAKAHWNPGGVAHGAPGAAAHHAGDLGNLEADAQGVARLDATTSAFGVAREPSALGRAVIVHEKPDDLTSQPAGNAGPRQGCGVVVKP